jgi:hypothetical protein
MLRGPLVPLFHVRPNHGDPPPATVRRLRSGHRSDHAASRGRRAVKARGPPCSATIGSSASCRAQPADPSNETRSVLRTNLTPCSVGIVNWCVASGPTRGLLVARGSLGERCSCWSAWPGRTRRGGIAGSMGSSRSWASTWHRPAFGTSSSVTASTLPRREPG